VDVLHHTLVFNYALHPGLFFMVAVCYTSFILHSVRHKTLKDMKHLLDSDFYVTFRTNIYLNNYLYLGAALWRQRVTGGVLLFQKLEVISAIIGRLVEILTSAACFTVICKLC
jgi:hypothetical protein